MLKKINTCIILTFYLVGFIFLSQEVSAQNPLQSTHPQASEGTLPVPTSTNSETPRNETTPEQTPSLEENLKVSQTPDTPVELPPQAGKKGDINKDGNVNILDYTLLSKAFGTSKSDEDLNEDGSVNIQDYIILSNNF